tara:strand:- start:558 stop:830 length:273 start_codon:yes stop_codon:yes gene_type:complete
VGVNMKKCNCDNTYRYPEKGKHVCVICGKDWPDDIESSNYSEAVKRKAKELYHDHMDLSCTNDFMWGQCSVDYREAWLTIAKEDLEEGNA